MKAVSELKYLGCRETITNEGKKYFYVSLFDSESIEFNMSEATYQLCSQLEFGTNVLVEFIIGTYSNRPNIRVGRLQIKK